MTDQTKAHAGKGRVEAAAKVARIRALRREAETAADVQPITGEQIKAARKLLGWSAATLAGKSNRSVRSVAKAESATLEPRYEETSLRAIRTALESADVVFVAGNGDRPGVRLRKAP